MDAMPFPPGVGGGRPAGDAAVSSYEVITPEKAIDESNVGNRMLRNMGWHEGLVIMFRDFFYIFPISISSFPFFSPLKGNAILAFNQFTYESILHIVQRVFLFLFLFSACVRQYFCLFFFRYGSKFVNGLTFPVRN